MSIHEARSGFFRAATLLTIQLMVFAALAQLFSANTLGQDRTIGKPVGETAQDVSQWTFPGSEIHTLSIENYSGDLVLRESGDGSLRIKATKHNASKADLEKVILDLKRIGDRVIGKVDYRTEFSSAAVAFLVEAPASVPIQLTSSSGNISVDNFPGKVRLETGSGTITLRDVGAEVCATTGSGEIHAYYTRPLKQIGEIASLAEARDKWSSRVIRNDQGGNIVVRAGHRRPGGAPRTLTTGSGNITLHVSAQLSVDVLAESMARRSRTDFPEIRDTGDGRNLAGSINGGGPLVMLSTSSGSISLKRF